MPMAAQNNRKENQEKKVYALRHAEYYGMQETYDALYARSLANAVFDNLMETILTRENILLAYRNIKGNNGSVTPGTDGLTMHDLAKMSPESIVRKVRNILKNYSPRPVRRKEIPKPNGKTRPLGIPCIWDRLVQQCILQALEPICEAKFSEHSHGFRPNRSCAHAIAQAARFIQLSHLHYVVEVDIKGFFDNVNHAKLIKQLWSMGVHDKKLLYIIRRILKAPILMPDGTLVKPDKGTPQGGILSPLLANVVLNELDKWIESQWQSNPIVLKYHISTNRNGSLNYGTGYAAMRNTRLKEMYIVRYADDFRIFCRNRKDAENVLEAVTQWLQDRLKLDVSPEKTRVVNLQRQYMEFLGFKIKTRKKGNKHVVKSHIGDKARKYIADRAVQMVGAMARPRDSRAEYQAVYAYNAFVMGEHNYYQIATGVSADFKSIAFRVDKVIKNRLGKRIKRASTKNDMEAVIRRYGKSKQLRFLSDHPIAPIGYVQNVKAREKKRSINKYTPEGRTEIHNSLRINTSLMLAMMRQTIVGRSVEMTDNRISLYCAQHGKCAITGIAFERLEDIHCHHKLPVNMGGKDNYQNLVLLLPDVHHLVHATDAGTIDRYMIALRLNATMLQKLNKMRCLAGNTNI